MEVYILLMVLSLFVAKFGKNKAVYWGFFLVLMFFSTFRSMDVGGDTEYYRWAFEDTESVKGSTIKTYEFGYLFLNLLVFYFIQDYTVFLGVTSFLVLFPIFFFSSKYSKRCHEIVAFYVLLYNFNFSLCFIRQFIAISILYGGYLICANTHKKKHLIIATLLATLFHQTSIIMLVLLPFVKLKYNRKLVAAIIFFSFFIGRLNPFISIMGMFGITSFYSGDVAGEMVFTFTGFIMTTYFAYIAYISNEKPFLLYTMMVGLLFFNMLVFNTNLSRINWSLYIVQTVILANMTLLPSLKKNVVANKIFSYAYAVILYVYFVLANQGEVVPYSFSF